MLTGRLRIACALAGAWRRWRSGHSRKELLPDPLNLETQRAVMAAVRAAVIETNIN